jgi:hypothetical protein
MSTHQGVAGPYVSYDGLPALLRTETALPLAHPYGPVKAGRYLTPGGGRLTIRTTAAHHRVTVDHLGCPAQATPEKERAFKELALAAEGRCLLAGCRHRALFCEGNVYRCFEVRRRTIELPAFVRALLAVELGDFAPTAALAAAVPIRPIRANRSNCG